MKKIKAGVIGGGNIAEFHLNDMVKNENIIPYALCDVNQESLDKTGDRYNIPKENRYTDYKELQKTPVLQTPSVFPTVISRRFRKPKKLFLPALLAKSIMSTHSILKEKMIMKIFLCCGVIRKNWPEAAALAIWVHICWI